MTVPSQPLDDHSRPISVLTAESTKWFPIDDMGPSAVDPMNYEEVVRVHSTVDAYVCLKGPFDMDYAMRINAGTIEYFYIPLGGGITAQAVSGTGTLSVSVMV